MTEFNIRRRLVEDGMTDEETEEVIAELANQRSDEDRDRRAEQTYKE